MIYTVTLNPALDKTVEIPGMALDTVNRVTSMRTDPGGKGINVSKVIAKLGGESCAVGILGGESGRTLLAALEREGLRTHFRFVEGQTRTNLKIIDRALHTNTDINEPGLTVSPADLDALLRDLLGMVREGDIVVLAGSLPQGAPQDTYRVWTAACREKGARVCLDADGVLLAEGLKAAPYLIKPNEDELSRLVGHRLTDTDELIAEGRRLLKDGVTRVVISLGERGALYLRGNEVLYAEGLSVPVGSTVGAGDSVVAALAYADSLGMSDEDAVRLSTATGAANVMCSGTQPAEREAVEKLLPQVKIRRI
nr:1-phosphofructokinase [uncultured Agathobaculum sp.]